MMVSPTVVTVDKADWLKVGLGDENAAARIRESLTGITIYEHNLSLEGGEIGISIDRLASLFRDLTLTIGFEK